MYDRNKNEFAFAWHHIRIAWSTTSYSHSLNLCWHDSVSYLHSSNCYQASCSIRLHSAVASCEGQLSLRQYCVLFLFAVAMFPYHFDHRDCKVSKKSSNLSQEELTSLCVLRIILIVRLWLTQEGLVLLRLGADICQDSVQVLMVLLHIDAHARECPLWAKSFFQFWR